MATPGSVQRARTARPQSESLGQVREGEAGLRKRGTHGSMVRRASGKGRSSRLVSVGHAHASSVRLIFIIYQVLYFLVLAIVVPAFLFFRLWVFPLAFFVLPFPPPTLSPRFLTPHSLAEQSQSQLPLVAERSTVAGVGGGLGKEPQAGPNPCPDGSRPPPLPPGPTSLARE